MGFITFLISQMGLIGATLGVIGFFAHVKFLFMVGAIICVIDELFYLFGGFMPFYVILFYVGGYYYYNSFYGILIVAVFLKLFENILGILGMSFFGILKKNKKKKNRKQEISARKLSRLLADSSLNEDHDYEVNKLKDNHSVKIPKENIALNLISGDYFIFSLLIQSDKIDLGKNISHDISEYYSHFIAKNYINKYNLNKSIEQVISDIKEKNNNIAKSINDLTDKKEKDLMNQVSKVLCKYMNKEDDVALITAISGILTAKFKSTSEFFNDLLKEYSITK